MIDVVSGGIVIAVVGMLASLIVGIRQENGAAVVNAFAAIVATLLPVALSRQFLPTDRGLALLPELTLWIGVAGFLHSLGMLGPYESTSWWDHLTHTVSATLAAALLYAALLVVTDATVAGASILVPLATVGMILALGVVWELLELVARDVGRRYDIAPVLVHYGWWDTGLDLVFDLVGALLVVLVDVRLFVPLVEPFPRLARTVLLVVVAGCLAGFVIGGLYVASGADIGGKD